MFVCLLYLFRIAIRPAAVIVAHAVAVATTAAVMIVVVVPISAVVVLVLIVILLVLLLLLMVMHLLGILLSILQPVPDGGIVLATSATAAAASSSTATIIHGRGHSTQDRMVQVIVERRRRVTHASHREPTRETALVVQTRYLRLLLLVGRHSLLLRVVLVRKLWLLLVMVVVGVTYLRVEPCRVNFGSSFHVGDFWLVVFFFSAGHV